MKKIFGIIILSIFVFSLLAFLPNYVFAVPDPNSPPTPTASASASAGSIPLPTEKPTNLPSSLDIPKIIKTVFDVIISVGEVAFIIVLLVGGVTYITSGGNEEQAGKARKLIINAVIGIVVLLSAWGIATWVLNTLGAIK